MIYQNVENLIGNTPLLKISVTSHGLMHTDVYAKLEYLNPFGSIKDRTALGITGDIDFKKLNDQNTQLIESSSGNTAKALQLIAGRQRNGLVSVTNRVKVQEIDQLLRYIGTDIIALPGRSECPDPSDADNALSRIKNMKLKQPDAYHHTDQYTNSANTEIHTKTTAHEIYNDLGSVDYFVVGIGTGGSSGGLIEYARQNKHSTKSVGVVTGGNDFLPGIRTRNELFETELFKKEEFEDVVEVESRDALAALDDLVRNEGILAGPTTGACFAVLRHYMKNHDVLKADGSRQTVVFIACDRLESYMSYITKRLPERFSINSMIDIMDKTVADEDKHLCEKQPDQSTLKWIDDNKVIIVDTRGVRPYNAFHIENSISYPDELLHEVGEHGTPFDKKRPVLFVCPRGDRSLFYASLLRDRGIQAYSLSGGLLAWRAAKLPFVRPSNG